MPNQDLIDYTNAQIESLNDQIAQKNQLKLNLDNGIAQNQATINDFTEQKLQADIDIVSLSDDVNKATQIKIILEDQP